MKRLYKIWQILIVTAVCLFIGGCQRGYYHEVTDCTTSEYEARVAATRLARFGVKILQSSQEMLIVIPSESLFNVGSANLKSSAYRILDRVVALMGYYEDKEVVAVAGFMDNGKVQNMGSVPALAVEKAHQVAKYLWSHDVDARLVYADVYDQIKLGNRQVISKGGVGIYFKKM